MSLIFFFFKQTTVLAKMINFPKYCHWMIKRPKKCHGSKRKLCIHGFTKHSLWYDERKGILVLTLQHISSFLILIVGPHVGEQMTPLVPTAGFPYTLLKQELAQHQGRMTGLDVPCAWPWSPAWASEWLTKGTELFSNCSMQSHVFQAFPLYSLINLHCFKVMMHSVCAFL